MTIKKNHIISTVFSVTGLLIVSKLLGFVKQMVTASAFGATLETDLINLSQGLIGNIQYLLVQSVLSASSPFICILRSRGRMLRGTLPLMSGRL